MQAFYECPLDTCLQQEYNVVIVFLGGNNIFLVVMKPNKHPMHKIKYINKITIKSKPAKITPCSDFSLVTMFKQAIERTCSNYAINK